MLSHHNLRKELDKVNLTSVYSDSEAPGEIRIQHVGRRGWQPSIPTSLIFRPVSQSILINMIILIVNMHLLIGSEEMLVKTEP